ncbi:hypothetical protein I307_01518 [Cryptococcus deuterogattii 99/473]|uniref:Unplaced genomic scaffold supercont1.11, whole genome shotgun sequence n=2 Tax=Cryptococcus deuterogattii TaxID=1859096 RepID=A0A0D0UWL6_9TREE|nr:hypothetical protein CNBG_4224 [Cryptococcus deuterogattii R265]KIR29609.1 hypothetical protein I309_01678 [Cryptococcus deuterogattii LA55]KIR34427.1 hypothetical protein I352_02673 [Cryptococcus deuterogattii MMRL2647]KIR39636.1 hypothetical protein I313_04662 [Cryptococcus deuterogattii Ram5]KIR73972.1 hypothetical protein I310_02650 [Cryptococcus deuterogattii CA1014]KIR93463.1 hypothetical protein I304_03132 [Cryptococcus deuterogattii CBS 10090]KIR99273.1 hypothetical protein L804_02
MSTTPIPHLYRSLLRELRLASHKSRTTRNPTVNTHIRTLVETSSNNPNSLSKILLETRDFLRATRIHAELLKRYNPTHGMSQEERVVATARRVGLNAPKEFEEKKE